MKLRRLALGIAAALLAGSGAHADETKFIMTTISSPTSQVGQENYHGWANRVNEAGKGIVSIDVIDGYSVANYRSWYDHLVNDVIQISFGPSDVGGRFKKITVPQVPFLVNDPAPASLALWRLYKTGMLDDEFADVVPLMLVVFPATSPHYREEPRSIASFAGLKVIGGSRVTSELIETLGGAPLAFPPADQYEALQRRTADGIFTNFAALTTFKMDEVTHYHVDVALGGAVGMVAMNRARYDALPAAARQIIAANATDKESHEFGAFFRDYEQTSRDIIAHEANQKIVSAPPDVVEKWQEKARPIENDWINANDGAAVLAKYKQLLADVGAGH